MRAKRKDNTQKKQTKKNLRGKNRVERIEEEI